MKSNTRNIIIVVVVLALGLLAYKVLNTREERTMGEKINAAVEKLDEGVDDAARELKDRTPAEKIKDEVKDATDSN